MYLSGTLPPPGLVAPVLLILLGARLSLPTIILLSSAVGLLVASVSSGILTTFGATLLSVVSNIPH